MISGSVAYMINHYPQIKTWVNSEKMSHFTKLRKMRHFCECKYICL
jgi:hypothetical protein